ncbi:hypothetical protein CALCODRAFT_83355 [Calocera cornea HHB12733]|uniref:Secreted protein n=1 Tax=Calocera cornea HHB12733 TaxID=1353952 RepID=A0A165IL52_9BASI|nr:hypothetical protein CALCODRAFT_83355 [Calocera cornea HHB12733]
MSSALVPALNLLWWAMPLSVTVFLPSRMCQSTTRAEFTAGRDAAIDRTRPHLLSIELLFRPRMLHWFLQSSARYARWHPRPCPDRRTFAWRVLNLRLQTRIPPSPACQRSSEESQLRHCPPRSCWSLSGLPCLRLAFLLCVEDSARWLLSPFAACRCLVCESANSRC